MIRRLKLAWIVAGLLVPVSPKRITPKSNYAASASSTADGSIHDRSAGTAAGEEHSGASVRRNLKSFLHPATVATSPNEHLVTSLPGLPDNAFPTKHYAGHVPVTDGFEFYWLFESSDPNPDSRPLVIWLNGGPGCSSMDGLWLENGPLRLDDDLQITINPYSWHNVANMLYVDQPLGTGLSFTTASNYADNDQQVDEQFYLFLCNFLKLHSRYMSSGNKSRPVFFSGESHAGHYIPSMVAYILEKNKANDGIVIDVQGMAIGNGWMDPINQYDVSDFAFGMGLIDAGQRRALKQKEETCVASLKAGKYQDGICMSLMDEIVADSGGRAGDVPRVSMYDVRKYEIGRDFPPGHRTVEKYLNRQDVRKAIHASSCPITFQECTDPPYVHLAQWDGLGVTRELRTALNAGVRSLFFNGQFDLICNHVGNGKVLTRLGGWKGAQEWEASRRGVWLSQGEEGGGDRQRRRPIGYVKELVGNPLTFLVVLDSGHMVPLDHPRSALDMISRFLDGRPFSDKLQKLLHSVPCEDGGSSGGCVGIADSGQPVAEVVEDNHEGRRGVDVTDSVSLMDVYARAAATSPPRIEGTPAVGHDFAVVHFAGVVVEEGEKKNEEGEGGAWGVEYEVVSSPGGIVGVGPSSPITVDGLTAGRSYTFTVTAVFHNKGQAMNEDGGANMLTIKEGSTAGAAATGARVRSAPSIGSPVVTPGCQLPPPGTESKYPQVTNAEACGAKGICLENGNAGVCLCESGYSGKKCELPPAVVEAASGAGREVGVGVIGGDKAIQVLQKEDIPVLGDVDGAIGSSKIVACELGIRFRLRPGAFGDPEFVYALLTSSMPSHEGNEEEKSPPSIAADVAARTGVKEAFSALVRVDVAQALGVPMASVSLESVSLVKGERDGPPVERNAWQDWHTQPLDVSIFVHTDSLDSTGEKLRIAWNSPESRLHMGVMMGLVDYSKGVEVSVRSRHESLLAEDHDLPLPQKQEVGGPGKLATFFYVVCFLLAIPLCRGMSRRFWSSRRPFLKRGSGSSFFNEGSGFSGGGSGVRRGGHPWRGNSGGPGGGKEDSEMVPLAMGGKEEEGRFVPSSESPLGTRIRGAVSS